MNRFSKISALFFILIMAISSLSLILVKPASAQSTTIPTIPTFTVQYTVNTINVTPTYTINPYTGQNETVGVNSSFENKSIEVTINNQPFNRYQVKSDGINYWVNLYYDVRYKGHFEENWTDSGPNGYFFAYPDTQNTTIPLFTRSPLPTAGQIDVQVQEFIGYIYYGDVFSDGHLIGNNAYFNGTGSGWSNTQALTIPASSTSPTPTPTVPEIQSWTIPLLLCIMLAVAGLLVYHKKHKPT